MITTKSVLKERAGVLAGLQSTENSKSTAGALASGFSLPNREVKITTHTEEHFLLILTITSQQNHPEIFVEKNLVLKRNVRLANMGPSNVK